MSRSSVFSVALGLLLAAWVGFVFGRHITRPKVHGGIIELRREGEVAPVLYINSIDGCVWDGRVALEQEPDGGQSLPVASWCPP